MIPRFTRMLLLAAICFLNGPTAFAKTIYINNRDGHDANDGSAPNSINKLSGPVLTFRRAVQLLDSSDRIDIANTGMPYYDSLSLVGTRCGGPDPKFPTRIIGNGATLSGLRQLPADSWRQDGNGAGLWSIGFTRKGFYRILRDGQALPEQRTGTPGDLAEGHWMAAKGKVWFKQDGFDEPGRQNFSYAADEVGLTFHRVDHVRVENLVLSNFRVDGAHAQQSCQDIVFQDCTFTGNGRAGVAATGVVSLTLQNCKIEQNGRNALITTGRARVETLDTTLDGEILEQR